MRALRTAITGMSAQELNVDTISNNIANMNTVGFKKQRAEFEDLMYQNVEKMGAVSSNAGTVVPTGVQIGSGVKTGTVYRITEQGTPTQTGNTRMKTEETAANAESAKMEETERSMPPASITTVRPVTTTENSPSWRVDSISEPGLKKPGMRLPKAATVTAMARNGMALSVQRFVRISPTR